MKRAHFFVALSAGLTALCGSVTAAQTAAITTTPIEHTRFEEVSNEVFAGHWGLTVEEATKYREYMNVEGRYFYAHLDPVMVLGIIETDPVRRGRYAEQWLKAERRRVDDQTGFASLVAATQLKLFGLEALFDFSKLPQAANSPGYWRARADRRGLAAPLAFSPLPENRAQREPATPQAGDTVDLLVDADCQEACYQKLDQVLKTPGVRVQLYGRGFKDNQGLLAWMEKWPIPAETRADAVARVEPRRFDPVIFGGLSHGKSPVALLRRNGAVRAKL